MFWIVCGPLGQVSFWLFEFRLKTRGKEKPIAFNGLLDRASSIPNITFTGRFWAFASARTAARLQAEN